MQKFCMRCERINTDGNLFCQDIDCPAERGYPIFEFGDYFGEFKILRLISVWRTAAVYEAQRGKFVVWVKVAHPDRLCEERLRQEANLLVSLAQHRPNRIISLIRSFTALPRPIYLELLAPFTNMNDRAFGEISINGITRTFFAFMPPGGVPLRNVLLEQPHVWHYEAAWVAITLTEALRPLNERRMLHLNIIPDIILIDIDKDKHWRPTLLDFGWICDVTNAIPNEAAILTDASYQAPELQLRRGSPASDSYSLGMLMFVMLTGRPAYQAKLRSEDRIREEVAQRRSALQINRPELVKAGIIETIERALDPDPRKRFSSPLEFADALKGIYGAPPKERRDRPMRAYALAILLIIFGLGGALLILLALLAI